MKSDGTDLRQLSIGEVAGPNETVSGVESPIFDSTGATIFFVTTIYVQLPVSPTVPGPYHTYRQELDAINSDGSGLRRLADFHPLSRGQLSLSPDGGTIAFTGYPEGSNTSEIYSMNLDGSASPD